MRALLLGLLSLALATVAGAQVQFPTPNGAISTGQVQMCLNAAGKSVPASTGTCAGGILTPIVTSSGAAATLVAKASPGQQLSVYVTNLTTTTGFLVGYNAVSAPADGALDPTLVLECVPLPGSGFASVSDQPGPSTNYTVGITYILTSAATCYTKTTGAITGFIKAKLL